MKNFLNFLGIGKFSNKTNQSDLKENYFFPKFNYEIEFLKALNNSPTKKLFGLNTFWEVRYTELLGDLNPIIENFLSSGFLEKSLKEEALTIKELKQILKANSLPLSGKKEELAMRVFNDVMNKDYQKGLQSHYKLTNSGINKFLEYKKTFEEELGLFYIHQSETFLKIDLKEFESNYFKLQNLSPDQRSLGATFTSFTEKTNSILKHLKAKKGTRTEWGFCTETQEKLRSALALRAINFSSNSDFLKKYFNDLEILEIKKSLRISEQNNLKALEIAIEFESSYLWNLYTLEELKQIPKRQSRTNRIKGVQILNDGCKCQEKFEIEKFKWKELSNLPKLPRSLLCRCIYNGYLD